MILGFTGLREAGKTSASNYLVEKYGFQRLHSFEAGKHMTVAYLEYIGIDSHTARRMVHGDLKDTPHERLPGGVSCRVFMEPFGNFMGVTMGPAWTVGVTMRRAEENAPAANFVFESVVYEADLVRQFGGKIYRVVRPGHNGVAGMKTDEAQAAIQVDGNIINDGTKEDLREKIDTLIFQLNVRKANE